MTGFTAALALLGVVLLILAGLYAAGQLIAVARPAPPAVPFTGGLLPAEHPVSRYHVRWYCCGNRSTASDDTGDIIARWRYKA